MVTGTLKINMLSDWHIGSGAGRPGSIDRLVQRDQDRLPYIPAKSLIGIIRDSCELVAQGLDNGNHGAWQQWVNWLFGEQQPQEDGNRTLENLPKVAQISVRSAHFSQSIRDAFQGKVLLQSMTTFVKPGVKINAHTGSALDQHLRFEEMTRSGAVLEASYDLNLAELSPEQQAVAQALLVTGVSMVERLGAKRRRGAGRCQITVEGLGDLQWAIAVIETTKGTPPPIPQVSSNDSPSETLALESQPHTDWWRVELEVETQSPVIIHKRTLGNHQETQDHIPGTYFLPIILKHLSTYLNTSLANALVHGEIVITNATMVVAEHRGQAVPFSLFEPKAKGSSVQPMQQRIGEPLNVAAGQQFKGIRRGYVHWDDSASEPRLHRHNVNSEIYAHNTIVDQKQRPDAEVGGIYTYEAIPAGQKFRLEVRIRDYWVPKTAANPLDKFLQTATSIQVGRTKKDDYGNAKIKQVSSGKMVAVASPRLQTLTVWLLSDLLLRDARLRPTTDPQILGTRLGEALGVSLTLLDEAQDELPTIDHLVAFTRTNRTESWQTKWGLPRPSLVGLSGGSVLQFIVTGEIDHPKLQALEISGLGDRTAEGFGQLRFNAPILTQKNLNRITDQASEVAASQKNSCIAQNSTGYEYAKLIEQETWREMIHRIAGAIAADPAQVESLKSLSLNTSKLTHSKLGTLRTLIDSLQSPSDANRVLTVIGKMEQKENWKGNTLNCVKELVKNEEEVWKCYQAMGGDFSQHRLTQDTEATLKQSLWAEAVRVLVDACVRTHKRASEESQSHQETANG
jgi:CRISPR-associated protein Csx10